MTPPSDSRHSSPDRPVASVADSILIKALARQCGAVACGIADVAEVDPHARAIYDGWIGRGCHGTMHYLENHRPLRDNPALLLPDAHTIIVCAFPYYSEQAVARQTIDHTVKDGELPAPHTQSRLKIASYALGDDYHKVIRRRLKQLATALREKCGGDTRVCVDTAPVRERYWAQRAGVGFIGVNNHLIVPRVGSRVFLGEVLWTGDATPDLPHESTHPSCSRCMRCVKACPGGAISPDGSIDARRCLSYLTIEHRGELPEGTNLHGCFYGCDTCQDVCPYNMMVPPLPEFMPREEITALTAQDILDMTPEEYNRIFAGSAMRRSPLDDMQYRARRLMDKM